jgi:Protein of unknown function (DUF3307)
LLNESLIICHLIGDFVLQNHVMATRKTSSSLWCGIHVCLYTLPFLVLVRSPTALAIILGTHFIIDRFALAKMWTEFYGVGSEGYFARRYRERFNAEWERRKREQAASIFPDFATLDVKMKPDFVPPPSFLGVWLIIIVDNTFHLLINHIAVNYL